MRVEGLRWLTRERPGEVTVKLRYRHPGVRAAVLEADGERAVLGLAEAQRGVAPGQAAVLYDGDRVVADGWIA